MRSAVPRPARAASRKYAGERAAPCPSRLLVRFAATGNVYLERARIDERDLRAVAAAAPCGCGAQAAALPCAGSSRRRARPRHARDRRCCSRARRERIRRPGRGNRAGAAGDRCCSCRGRARARASERRAPPACDRRCEHADWSAPASRATSVRPLAAASSAVSQSTSRHSPSSLAPSASCARSVAVDAFVAEAVAIGDPGLVDLFVGARHDAHQLARATRARRCSCRRSRAATRAAAASFPRRGRGNGTACC